MSRYPALWRAAVDQAMAPQSAIRKRQLAPTMIESIKEEHAQRGLGVSIDTRIFHRPWGFEVKGISVPTYLWHGEVDLLAQPAFGHYLADHIPNCHAIFYPNESHVVFAAHVRGIIATLADVAQREVATEHDEP